MLLVFSAAVKNPSCYPGDKQAEAVVWLANGSAAQTIYPTLHSAHFHLTLLGISQFGLAAASHNKLSAAFLTFWYLNQTTLL